MAERWTYKGHDIVMVCPFRIEIDGRSYTQELDGEPCTRETVENYIDENMNSGSGPTPVSEYTND